MEYNFDEVIHRRGTASYKWDQSEKLFGDADILPMWVADMDFRPPAEVVEVVKQRAELGVYGYTFRTQGYLDAIVNWMKTRHDWSIHEEWIVSSPGVVVSLSLLVELLTEPGDRVIIQTPVYYPFYDVIRMNRREVVRNSLMLEDGQYKMNFKELEEQMAAGAKCLLFCSPHNPGGRVWSRAELIKLGELALKYNVKIISDEIHQDHVYSGYKHYPLASLSDAIAGITATCVAPSKTFNIAGLQTSAVVISDPELRRKYAHRTKALSLHMDSYFGGAATEASYQHGGDWLDQLLVYLEGNRDTLLEFFERELPQCKVMKPQGTYLAWVDCSAISPDPAVLKKLMFEKAKVAFSDGSTFGEEGRGFLRVNLACPRSLLVEGLRRFADAVKAQ